MRPIQLLILLVAFGAAAMAGMIAMNMSAAPPPPPPETAVAPTVATQEVLVATRNLDPGTPVTPDAISWRVWPADGLADGFITRTQRPDALTELQGTLVRDPIFVGEPVRDAKLVRSDRGFLSAVLPKGMRAVAVRVNAASTAGGFILPNDRVDVILIRQAAAGSAGATSETILTNVRVLAIDQTVENVTDDTRTVVVAQDTATLELAPENAELITQAQQVGTISLSLRSIEDQTTDEDGPRRPAGVSVVKYGISSRISAPESQ